MSAFREQVTRWALHVGTVTQETFANIAAATQDSIRFGSPVTSAPGQPVDTGALRDSWQLDYPGPMQAFISTNLIYAPFIEEGLAPQRGFGNVTGQTMHRLVLRSPVGGFHSVALTVLNFDRLVAVVVAEGAHA